MHGPRLVRLAPPIVILVAIALFAEPRVGATSSITSRILIDPAGEHTGDEFGHSVAWVGDVNGDGYDDLLVGAFRYPCAPHAIRPVLRCVIDGVTRLLRMSRDPRVIK